jgi:hypothetical protein
MGKRYVARLLDSFFTGIPAFFVVFSAFSKNQDMKLYYDRPGASIFGGFFCGIGQTLTYVSPFFDSSGWQRGWHDKVAKTQVINA